MILRVHCRQGNDFVDEISSVKKGLFKWHSNGLVAIPFLSRGPSSAIYHSKQHLTFNPLSIGMLLMLASDLRCVEQTEKKHKGVSDL